MRNNKKRRRGSRDKKKTEGEKSKPPFLSLSLLPSHEMMIDEDVGRERKRRRQWVQPRKRRRRIGYRIELQHMRGAGGRNLSISYTRCHLRREIGLKQGFRLLPFSFPPSAPRSPLSWAICWIIFSRPPLVRLVVRRAKEQQLKCFRVLGGEGGMGWGEGGGGWWSAVGRRRRWWR